MDFRRYILDSSTLRRDFRKWELKWLNTLTVFSRALVSSSIFSTSASRLLFCCFSSSFSSAAWRHKQTAVIRAVAANQTQSHTLIITTGDAPHLCDAVGLHSLSLAFRGPDGKGQHLEAELYLVDLHKFFIEFNTARNKVLPEMPVPVVPQKKKKLRA